MSRLTRQTVQFVLMLLGTVMLIAWRSDVQNTAPASTSTSMTSTSTTSSTSTSTSTSTTSTSTTVAIGFDALCPDAVRVAIDIGWPTSELETLDLVVWRESRCRQSAHNTADPGSNGSIGWAQINTYWCDSTQYYPAGWLQTQGVLSRCDDLFDPVVNLGAALAIWQRSGWSPWATI